MIFQWLSSGELSWLVHPRAEVLSRQQLTCNGGATNEVDSYAMKRDESTSIRTIVFDFGGVFTESPIGVVRSAASKAGVNADAAIALMFGDYGVESDHPWQRVERGEIPLDQARVWAQLESKRQLGVEMDPKKIMGALMETPIRSCMVELVEELRNHGLNTALLTNNARELRHHWHGLADWDSLFHAVVDSSEIGVRKPSASAFNFALEGCGETEPARALMVDDFAENINGAESLGMRGILVGEDPGPAIDAIRELVLS